MIYEFYYDETRKNKIIGDALLLYEMNIIVNFRRLVSAETLERLSLLLFYGRPEGEIFLSFQDR